MCVTLSLPDLPPQHLAQFTHPHHADTHTHMHACRDTVSAHRSVGKVWRADFQRSAQASDRKLAKYAGYFSVTWTEFMIRSSAPVSSCLTVKGAILPATCTSQFRSVALGVCGRATSGRGHSVWHRTGHRVRQASGIKEATSGSREIVWKVYFWGSSCFIWACVVESVVTMSGELLFQMWMVLLLGTSMTGFVRAQVSTARVMRGNIRRDGEVSSVFQSVAACVAICFQSLCLFCWNCWIKWPPCRKVYMQIYKWV